MNISIANLTTRELLQLRNEIDERLWAINWYYNPHHPDKIDLVYELLHDWRSKK